VRALPPLAALLAFTRPEGVLAGGLAILCVLWLRPHDRARQLGWAALAFALPLALGEAARLAYYHLPLPLPYYVKLAHPGMFAGAGVVGRWLGDHAWRLGPFVLVAALRPPRSLWPALAVTAALAAFFTLPQHLMGYQHRYVAPCDPTLCVLAAVGLDRLVRAAARRRWPGQIVTWAAPALVLLAGALELTDARLDVPERLAYARGMASAHLPVAHALAALGGHGRIVLSDAGSIPYYTDWWTYDLVGLNEPSVALTHRREPAQILAPAPDAIVLVSLHADRFAPWDWNAYEAPLLTAALRAGYAHVATRRFGDDYWLWLLAKPGTRVARALAAAR
jgi:hypothetical protein